MESWWNRDTRGDMDGGSVLFNHAYNPLQVYCIIDVQNKGGMRKTAGTNLGALG